MRLVAGVLGLLLLLALLVVIVGVFTVRRPFPDVDGQIALAGLNDEVTVGARRLRHPPHLCRN